MKHAESGPLRLWTLVGATVFGAVAIPARAAEPEAAAVEPELAEIYRRGGAAFDAADYAAAIAVFGEGVAASGRRGDMRMRAYFMVSLALSHLKAHAADGDRSRLVRAKDLLGRVLDERPNVLDAASHAKASEGLAEAEERLATAEALLPSPAPGEAPPGVAEAAPRSPRVDHRPPDRPGRAHLGVALMATGAASTLGGLAAILYAAIAPRVLQDRVEADNQQAYLDEHVPRVRVVGYAVGGVLVGAGAGLIAAGAVIHVRAARSRTSARLRFAPAIVSAFGVRIHGEF